MDIVASTVVTQWSLSGHRSRTVSAATAPPRPRKTVAAPLPSAVRGGESQSPMVPAGQGLPTWATVGAFVGAFVVGAFVVGAFVGDFVVVGAFVVGRLVGYTVGAFVGAFVVGAFVVGAFVGVFVGAFAASNQRGRFSGSSAKRQYKSCYEATQTLSRLTNHARG